jgi:hypothetical protein
MRSNHILLAAMAGAIALLMAPPALAGKSFDGKVKGGGIVAEYTIEVKGKKKVCVTYGGSQSANAPEDLVFEVKDGKDKLKFKDPRPQDAEYCKSNKKFAKALKKAGKVKVTGTGAYGEELKGTLK